jgi:hypothetical protein
MVIPLIVSFLCFYTSTIVSTSPKIQKKTSSTEVAPITAQLKIDSEEYNNQEISDTNANDCSKELPQNIDKINAIATSWVTTKVSHSICDPNVSLIRVSLNPTEEIFTIAANTKLYVYSAINGLLLKTYEFKYPITKSHFVQSNTLYLTLYTPENNRQNIRFDIDLMQGNKDKDNQEITPKYETTSIDVKYNYRSAHINLNSIREQNASTIHEPNRYKIIVEGLKRCIALKHHPTQHIMLYNKELLDTRQSEWNSLTSEEQELLEQIIKQWSEHTSSQILATIDDFLVKNVTPNLIALAESLPPAPSSPTLEYASIKELL